MFKKVVRLATGLFEPFTHFIMDTKQGIMDKDGMVPPRYMVKFIGGGDYEQIGQEFKDHFIKLANLQPHERVLDVGCGVGRMAVPLTSYLSGGGEYWGFDIYQKGIQWCQERISSKFTNFHFLHSNVCNKHYNPEGRIMAKDYRFPFEDSFFDFIFLTSVFTHMLPADLENYTKEISRVLKPGGRCLITFFLMNEESENLVRNGSSTLNFIYEMDGFYTTEKTDPEAAIAYKEAFVDGLLQKYNLMHNSQVYYGKWCRRQKYLQYQDLIVVTRK